MDEMIQEWMNEDKYLAKLTKRQRSIASNKLRFKLAPYVGEKYTPKLTKRQRSIASKKLSNKLLHCDIHELEPEVKMEVESVVEPVVEPKVDPEVKVKTETTIKRKADLIHEWINEDQLLTKYTKRQKVILCKSLIQKLDTDRSLERALEEAIVVTQELESKVARYQKAYRALLRSAYSTRSADRFCKMICVIWMALILRSIMNTVIASIPPRWCSATALPQTEPYKTLGLP